MDRHPQQIKRTRQDAKRRKQNVMNTSRLRTMVKKVLKTADAESAAAPYKEAVSFIDKMATRHLIHKNTAARKKSQITRHVNSLS